MHEQSGSAVPLGAENRELHATAATAAQAMPCKIRARQNEHEIIEASFSDGVGNRKQVREIMRTRISENIEHWKNKQTELEQFDRAGASLNKHDAVERLLRAIQRAAHDAEFPEEAHQGNE